MRANNRELGGLSVRRTRFEHIYGSISKTIRVQSALFRCHVLSTYIIVRSAVANIGH